jgi:threonine dehydrogenase-like Zn-dependent dehydrogenase
MGAAGSVANRTVVVLGAGVLGLTACAMAQANGAKVVLAVDPSPASRDRARRFGATHAVEPGEAARSQVAELTSGRGADVVLELAGTGPSVQSAIDLIRTGGVVILAGTVTPTAALPLDPERLVRRMTTLRGVHNYHPRDLAAALKFLAGSGRQFPFSELVGSVFPLDQACEAFAAAHASHGIRIAVVP